MADRFVVPRMDYSWLSQLPEQFAQGEALGRQDALRGALSKIPLGPNGEQDFGAMMKAFSQYGTPSDVANMVMTRAQLQATENYRKATLEEQTRSRDIEAAKGIISSYTPQQRDYFAANPPAMPPELKQAIATLRGEDQGAPALGTTPAAAGAASAPTQSFEQYSLIKAGKMAPPEQARSTKDILNVQLDMFRSNAEKIQADPNLYWISGRMAQLPEQAQKALSLAYPELENTKAQLQSLGAQTRSNIMQMYRELGGGKTGFGRVLLKEWENFGDVLAPLSRRQTPEALRANLQRVINFSRDSKQRINSEYKRMYGSDIPTQEQQVAPGVTTTSATGLPPTAPPSAGNIPVQGAAIETSAPTKLPPDQLRNFLNTETSGTLHLSDGRTIRGIKRDGHWYDADTGQRVQ